MVIRRKLNLLGLRMEKPIPFLSTVLHGAAHHVLAFFPARIQLRTVTVDQDGFHDASYNGLLVECTYIADGTEVTFTIDPTAAATWHLYAFSNRIESNLDVVTKWNDKSGKGKSCSPATIHKQT